jgi:hypothetical protein
LDLSQIVEKNKIYILAPKVTILTLKSDPKVTLRAKLKKGALPLKKLLNPKFEF